jgi:hypothetical protein
MPGDYLAGCGEASGLPVRRLPSRGVLWLRVWSLDEPGMSKVRRPGWCVLGSGTFRLAPSTGELDSCTPVFNITERATRVMTDHALSIRFGGPGLGVEGMSSVSGQDGLVEHRPLGVNRCGKQDIIILRRRLNPSRAKVGHSCGKLTHNVGFICERDHICTVSKSVLMVVEKPAKTLCRAHPWSNVWREVASLTDGPHDRFTIIARWWCSGVLSEFER